MFTTPFHAVPESTTEDVTDATEIWTTEIGTRESETTGIYTTEGMIHLREVGCYIFYISKMLFIWF